MAFSIALCSLMGYKLVMSLAANDGDRVPIILQENPILETSAELGFVSDLESASDLLLGPFFKDGEWKEVERLPSADIPWDVRRQNESLRKSPRYSLRRDNSAIFLGDEILTFVQRRPYRGWDEFFPKVTEVFQLPLGLGVIRELTSLTLRYVNFFVGESGLRNLNLQLFYCGSELNDAPLQLLLRFGDDDAGQTIRVLYPAVVSARDGQEEEQTGLLLVLESRVKLSDKTEASRLGDFLNQLHDECRREFFKIIKPETLDNLMSKR